VGVTEIKHNNEDQLMKKSGHKIFKSTVLVLSAVLILLMISCDFQSPSDFEMPTWFINLTIPLVEETYPLGGMVDDEQIFATSDSLGMQIIFEGSLPDTSIDESYLQVPVNQTIDFAQDPVYSPNMAFSFDTLISIEIPFAPNNQFVDVDFNTFDVPSATDNRIFKETWNQIASAFDTTISVDITIPSVNADDLPDFITDVKAIVITADSGTDSSLFQSTILNNGLPTAIRDVEFSLLTDPSIPDDTLAMHTKATVEKDSTFNEYTLIGDKQLIDKIQLNFGFGLEEETVLDTITINAGDSVKVNLTIRIRIAGVDEAIVEVSEYDLSPEIPAIEFPSDIEIYSGIFKDPSFGLDVNEIAIRNLQSTYLFDIDYSMNFRNFLPPAGEDSVKISTILSRDSSAYSRTFDLDGYTFANPVSPDSALKSLIIDVVAMLRADTAAIIPLDGSEFGSLTLGVDVQELHFESLQANLIQEFPPTEQEMAGMPQGFSGMAFTDVQIEFIMKNQIQLPVMLDLDMIGINTFGDSSIVRVQAQMGSPDNAIDTIKTIIRLSRDGTTTLIYDSPSDSVASDSTLVPPGPGESTIVDLLSFNPEFLMINSTARIDGRGTIVVGASIGGGYRLIAPFEVRMSPMTFIPVNESPLEEWDYELRNKIRSGLRSASAVARVTNHFPVGGDISILLSNQANFPLDKSRSNLDSMAVALGIDISAGDSLYVVNECSVLDPSFGADSSIYIFNIMSDFSECVDGVSYFVRSSTSGVDTVVAYVDTLLKIVLPDPTLINYDSDNDDRRLVDIAGDIVTSSIMDPAKIQLMTSAGDHYTTPRIHLNGSPIDPITGDTLPVFLALKDYITIKSFLTFEISSTGLMESAPSELVIQYPNGGESINVLDPITIRWRTFGKVNTVNLDYSYGSTADIEVDDDWTPLESNWIAIANVDSFIWDASTIIQNIPGSMRDSVRIRISDAGSDIKDMSGWYFTLKEVLRSITGVTGPVGLKSGGRK